MNFRLDLLFERRNADHEKFVEVGLIDRQKLQAFEKRRRFVERFFQHAIVEGEPREFATNVKRRIVEGTIGPRRGRAGARLGFPDHLGTVRRRRADLFAKCRAITG